MQAIESDFTSKPIGIHSLHLVKQESYAIGTEINLSDIENLMKMTVVEKEPSISFPQANSMARIINLIELLYGKPMTRKDITTEYAFDERQTNYYTDALLCGSPTEVFWLKFVTKLFFWTLTGRNT